MIAHIQEETGMQQPLKEHLAHTALIAQNIGDPLNMGCLSFLSAYFHDLGKGRRKFQDYLEAAVAGESRVRRGSVNHSSAGGIYLYNRCDGNDYIQKLAAQLMAVAVFSHHGLMDCLGADGTPAFRNRLTQLEDLDYEEVLNYMADCMLPEDELDAIFGKAVEEVKVLEEKTSCFVQAFRKQKQLDKADAACRSYFWSAHERLLLSIVIDADRLDTAAFCGSRDPESESRNHAACHDDIWALPMQHLEEHLQRFERTDKVSLLRKQISEDCLNAASGKGGILRLAVPTGGGKTLSSVRYAIHHAQKYGKKRIIYTAPYLSILEQNAEVFRDALGDGLFILEHHSNVIDDGEQEETEKTLKRRYMTENWDAAFIATTSVQFLNTLFSDSTQCIRRFHNLADAVIIVDEIQALPLQMIDNFNMMLNYLYYVMGSTIVLCSATQPALEQVEYPVLLGENKDIVADYHSLYRKLRRVEIIPVPERMDSTRLCGYCMELLETNGQQLVILNTKSAVQKVYKKLKSFVQESGEDIRLIHLSTNMCAQHRLSLIREIKHMPASGKLICVSTNLIEAGVDVSFGCVIRSFAGLDSIAQAAGRCNRNGELKGGLGKVYLIQLEEEYLGRLKHIRRGAICSEDITADYLKHPESYDDDLLSPASMEIFYHNYYHGEEQKSMMRYQIKDAGRNMLGLLSHNIEGLQAYTSRFGNQPLHQVMYQASKYAGKQFRAIDSDTVPVIVPYGKGEEIIAELNGNIKDKKIRSLLRQAQRYTVNVYPNKIKELAEADALTTLFDGSVYALKGGFYEQDIGVTCEGKMSFLTVD